MAPTEINWTYRCEQPSEALIAAPCVHCRRLEIQLLLPFDRTGETRRSPYRHSTAADLAQSSSTCALCALIREAWAMDDDHRADRFFSEFPDAWIQLGVDRRHLVPKYGNLWSIRPLLVVSSDRHRHIGRLCLCTPSGTCGRHGSFTPDWVVLIGLSVLGSPLVLSGDGPSRPLLVALSMEALMDRCLLNDMPWRPPLIDFSPLQPSVLIQDWLKTCLKSHSYCRERFIGGLAASEDPDAGWVDAPARLVRIFLEDAEMGVLRTQLVSSADVVPQQGHGGVPKYATLSHCWGTAEKRPLCTTKTNLQEHMASIPCDKLPQTFRDVVEVCAQLRVQYVWIDSLCIIQDDPLDWKSEARKMGSVYENACFTIAASAAQDSSAGLFKVRQPPEMVPFPYRGVDGKQNQVHAYLPLTFQNAFRAAPLDQRAWVFQEYFLSRRTVHFTRRGLVWTCYGTLESRYRKEAFTRYISSEFGELDDWMSLETTWQTLVQSYSERQLTFKADKLIALEGLRQQFGAKRLEDDYRHGLWKRDLPRDLLWYGETKLVRDIPAEAGIPSWSWASTTGTILFRRSALGDAMEIGVDVQFSKTCDKHLIVNGWLQLVDEFRGPGRSGPYRYEDLSEKRFQGRLQDRYRGGEHPTFLLLSREQKVGWVVFDSFKPPTGPIYCLSLLRELVAGWYSPSADGLPVSKEPYLLWVLALERSKNGVDEHVDFYERVGWEVVLAPSWMSGEQQEVILK